MYMYGLTYAITSLGCSIGPFLVVVGSTLRHGDIATGLASYLAYAAGMGLVVGAAGSAAVLAQRSGARTWRPFRRLAPVLGGGLLTLMGSYLAWYGIYEVRLRSGADGDDRIVRTATGLQHSLAGWIDRAGPLGLAGLLLIVILGIALADRRVHSSAGSPATGNGVASVLHVHHIALVAVAVGRRSGPRRLASTAPIAAAPTMQAAQITARPGRRPSTDAPAAA